MRLTESRLRNIIRSVIREGFLNENSSNVTLGIDSYEHKNKKHTSRSDLNVLKSALPNYYIIDPDDMDDFERYVSPQRKPLGPNGEETILPLTKDNEYIYFKFVDVSKHSDDAYGKVKI